MVHIPTKRSYIPKWQLSTYVMYMGMYCHNLPASVVNWMLFSLFDFFDPLDLLNYYRSNSLWLSRIWVGCVQLLLLKQLRVYREGKACFCLSRLYSIRYRERIISIQGTRCPLPRAYASTNRLPRSSVSVVPGTLLEKHAFRGTSRYFIIS
jgi:hypothetical protein